MISLAAKGDAGNALVVAWDIQQLLATFSLMPIPAVPHPDGTIVAPREEPPISAECDGTNGVPMAAQVQGLPTRLDVPDLDDLVKPRGWRVAGRPG